MPRPNSERRSAWPTVVLGGVLAVGLLTLLYVASVGPACRLVASDQMGMGAYHAIYAPLGCVENACRPIGRRLGEYRCLFVSNDSFVRSDDDDRLIIKRLILAHSPP